MVRGRRGERVSRRGRPDRGVPGASVVRARLPLHSRRGISARRGREDRRATRSHRLIRWVCRDRWRSGQVEGRRTGAVVRERHHTIEAVGVSAERHEGRRSNGGLAQCNHGASRVLLQAILAAGDTCRDARHGAAAAARVGDGQPSDTVGLPPEDGAGLRSRVEDRWRPRLDGQPDRQVREPRIHRTPRGAAVRAAEDAGARSLLNTIVVAERGGVNRCRAGRVDHHGRHGIRRKAGVRRDPCVPPVCRPINSMCVRAGVQAGRRDRIDRKRPNKVACRKSCADRSPCSAAIAGAEQVEAPCHRRARREHGGGRQGIDRQRIDSTRQAGIGGSPTVAAVGAPVDAKRRARIHRRGSQRIDGKCQHGLAKGKGIPV